MAGAQGNGVPKGDLKVVVRDGWVTLIVTEAAITMSIPNWAQLVATTEEMMN